MRLMASRRKLITECIQKVIRFWLEGDLKSVANMIDEEVVMYIPYCHSRIVGRRDFLEVLGEFQRRSHIRRFDESDFVVDTHGDLAVAHYRFHIEYEIGKEEHSESGIDLFVFQKRVGTWKIVRRQMLCS